MTSSIFGWLGKFSDYVMEGAVIGKNLAQQASAWFVEVTRLNILRFTERRYPDSYMALDGGDKRIMRAFLDPGSLSNTYSLIGGTGFRRTDCELRMPPAEIVRLLSDALGTEAAFDNSFVEREEGADRGPERWFFINGIVTSRYMARLNVDALRKLFKRPFTLIHNPTQGLTNDLLESTLQKFTNINTEPVARAYLEIGEALLDPAVESVVVIAHSQGTIIMGDVLDLLYCSIDRKYFDRTNMNDEDFDSFLAHSVGTVKTHELKEMQSRLSGQVNVIKKLELYMFANAASRMCYLDPDNRVPHIESFANEHDIVTRLGSLARDDFHVEDLIRIDGSLFTCPRYGHLLNTHYLPDFAAGDYRLRDEGEHVERCIGGSIHDRVYGNPCRKHPKHREGPPDSRLFALYQAARNVALPPSMPENDAAPTRATMLQEEALTKRLKVGQT